MKTHPPTNLSRHVTMQNRNIQKNHENFSSARMQLQSIIGLQYKPNLPTIKGEPIILLNKEEVLYYSCNYFVKFNLLTKQYHLIKKETLNGNLPIPGVIANTTMNNSQINQEEMEAEPSKKNGRDSCAKERSQTYRMLASTIKSKLINENTKESFIPTIANDQIYYMRKIVRPNPNLKNQRKCENGISKGNAYVNTILAVQNCETSINIHLLNVQQGTFKSQKENSDDQGSSKKNKAFSYIKIPVTSKINVVTNLSYQSDKNYVYFLLSHSNSAQQDIQKMAKIEYQSLVIVDLSRQRVVMNISIKPTSNNVIMSHIITKEDHCQIYLIGLKYFRLWQLDFGEKSMKESNFRNVQRSIKEHQILDWIQIRNNQKQPIFCKNSDSVLKCTNNGFRVKGRNQNLNQNQIEEQRLSSNRDIQTSKSIGKEQANRHSSANTNGTYLDFKKSDLNVPSFIILLTKKKFIFIKDNELLGVIEPQMNISKNQINNMGIEQDLENSLNQIYKMKFAFQNMENDDQDFPKDSCKIQIDQIMQFKTISQSWMNSDRNFTFAVGTNQNKVLLYKINSSFQVKLDTQYELSKNTEESQDSKTSSISVSPKGQVIVCTNIPHNIAYYVNRSSYNNQEESQMQPVWGCGHMHHEEIIGLDSPSVRNVMISISAGQTSQLDHVSTVKLWKMSRRDRSIMIDRKYKSKVLTVSMHPSGHLFALNFEREIKLLSIVAEEFYEVTSQKNIHSAQISFSNMGHFLVSLENGRIKFYEPFTLKSLCYIEPEDLKLSIVNFRLSADDQYIFFECNDYSMMRQKIDLKAMAKSVNPSQLIKICHRQNEEYNTYFYQPVINERHFKFLEQNNREKNVIKNLFIGFTKTKYLTLYKNEGEQLISQFPVVNSCYITDIEVLQEQGILFAATSIGSIRVYNWPILQCHFLMQVTDAKSNKIRFLPPSYNQLQVWLDKSSIRKIHKIKFSNELIATNCCGNISVINFQPTKAGKLHIEQVPSQRKKLMKSINDYYFVRASQLEKREKLIEKTQNDILKVENQILRQKKSREDHLNEQEWQIHNNFQKKNMSEAEERKQCVLKQQVQVQKLKKELQLRNKSFEELKGKMKNASVQKKDYQKNRNQQLQLQTLQIVKNHKQKIRIQIERHKNSIRQVKQNFQNRVKNTQAEFNKFIEQINLLDSEAKREANRFSQFNTTNQSSNTKNEGFFSAQDQQNDPTVLVKFKQNLLKDQQNDHINSLLTDKVEILEKQITKMKQDYNDMMEKVYELENQDEVLQKQFQSSLQNYNQKRFANLCMHSQVLKMQNQLIQRQQILENKDKVITMVYNEKYKLENYKELVKGALTNLQQRKEQLFDVFVNKENDLNQIFTELVQQIKKDDKKKLMIADLEQAKDAYEEENRIIEKKIEQEILNLRELKKFLLLEGSSQDSQQKRLYEQRQNTQGSINWLKKRLHMAGINEKKNINLKKTSLGLVLRQNQNLLEQCNQLRSQGIEYQNEIRNLSNKLRQANNLITLEAKLRTQKDIVQDQKVQLDRIKMLFDQHLSSKPQEDQANNEFYMALSNSNE